MKKLSLMLKPASSACNLKCRYCFYTDEASAREVRNFGIMTEDTVNAVLGNVFCCLESGDEFTFIFQGGEPAVAGLEWFTMFIGAVNRLCPKGVKVFYCFQTNGTFIDDEWCKFFKANNFLVGVSLDIYKELHDMSRVDAHGDGTYAKVFRAIKTLEKFNIEYNILSVVTEAASKHPDTVWNSIITHNFRYIQFSPCLGGMKDGGAEKGGGLAVSPKSMCNFYSAVFNSWLKEFQRGNYISVKLFDDLACLLANKGCNACGLHGGCGRQIVIESDGGAYPCDFYMTDEYRIGSLKNSRYIDLLFCDKAEKFRRGQPPEQCRDCRYGCFCGGGCKRMYGNMYFQDGICHYALLLDDILPRLYRAL